MSINYGQHLISALTDIEEIIENKNTVFMEALGEEVMQGRELAALKGAIDDLKGLTGTITKIKAKIEYVYKSR